MRRLLVDLSSVSWRSLLAGEDKEFGKVIDFEGKQVKVNSALYGYENAMNHIVTTMKEYSIVPINVILVREGKDSKEHRKYLSSGAFEYKGTRSTRPPEAYAEFNTLNDMLCDALCNVGASVATQDGIEADDVIAYLAHNLQGERYILTSDGDLAALITGDVHLIRNGELDPQPFGPIKPRWTPIFKALVGDSSDNIPGVKGFGPKAFLDLFVSLTDEDMDYLLECFKGRKLHTLKDAVAEHPQLKKVLEQEMLAYKSFECACLYPQLVNTLRRPLVWRVGMQMPFSVVRDERLKQWCQQSRIITADNYEKAVDFLKAQTDNSPYFCLDLETTVPEESDEWLANTSKGGKGGIGVDVIGSTIVSCALSFGDNLQYSLYFSVDHADTDNITLEQLASALALVPQDKITIAHNAAGFELPVMYNAWGTSWANNGWRGFFPNMVDSRIASSYVDENRFSHGLKGLSKEILGYEQTTYAEVTGGKKMHELSAQHVVAYGIDDVYTCGALWNYFRMVMELEGSLTTFMEYEQKPMYLSALSYTQGIKVSTPRLIELTHKAAAEFAEHEKVLNEYLIEKGWEGTQVPIIADVEAKTVKAVVKIVTGLTLETMVKKQERLALEVAKLDHPYADLISVAVANGDLASLNKWVAEHYNGTPNFDVASPKQVAALVYGTMGLPVRLRNKVTAAMRAKGVREGSARTDDDALGMLIKLGDATPEQAPVLKSLIRMKSIATEQGLYYTPYPSLIHWKTGRMHPELRQSSTVTRRFTSANANFQQLNAERGGIRSIIIAHHRDAFIGSLDESAQEVRCVADLSGDKNLATCYVGAPDQLRDVHSIVACKVAGVSYEEFRRRLKKGTNEEMDEANEVRQKAKITLFSWVYGASAPKIAETLGISESEAQGYVDSLNEQFPRLAEWKIEIEAFTEQYGYAPLMLNTRRHLGKAIMSEDRWEASKARRQASNAAIQSSCALQMKGVMAKIWDSNLLDDFDFRWYMPIHDETLISVGRKDAVPVLKQMHDIMCAPFLKSIPSASSIGVGLNYGELNELGEVFDAEKIEAALVDLFSNRD